MNYIPKNNREMEMAVIGCMLVDGKNAKQMAQMVDPKWFYHEAHAQMFNLMKLKLTEGHEPDIQLLAAWLTDKGQLAAVGGMEHIANCIERVSTTAHQQSYITEIRKYYYDRLIYAAAQSVANDPSYGNTDDLRRLCHDRDTTLSSGCVAMKDCSEMICGLMEPLKKGMYEIFGLKELDEAHNGSAYGNILTIGARPGTGKTVIATQIAVNFARKYNEPVLMFTTEMQMEETIMRMLAPMTHIPGWRWRKRCFNPNEDIPAVLKSAGELTQLPIFINDKPSPTLADIQAGMLSTKCRLVIVDYIQRLNLEIGRNDSRPEAIGRMMMGIKNTSRDLESVAIVLSQMDRETDKLTGRNHPQLSDLKGSGDIEQESDAVLLMWKHNKKDPDTKKGVVPDLPTIKPVEFILAKNRHGRSDTSIQMVFDEKFIEFREWNRDEEERCLEAGMRQTTERLKTEEQNAKPKQKPVTTNLPTADSGGFTPEPGD